jgi:predicted DCC family thiol-disulfide oxidoreductase YuxK
MTTPTLVYDDDCEFCTWWADQLDRRSDLRVVGFSALSPELLDRLPDDYEECSHLVTDETVYSCGASIEEAVVRSDLGTDSRHVVEFLRRFEEYERLREHGYGWVADNRSLLGSVLSKTPSADTRLDTKE